MMRLGVDLGGTKIEAIALGDDGRELVRRRVPTPAHSARAIVDAIGGLVSSLEDELGARGSVGVATPGALSPASGLMKNSNTTCLNGQPLDRMLCEALGREVRLANDANCFALSEATDGAAAGAGVVFGVILGTGTGGGIVVDGRVLAGAHAIAGEWGHNALPWREAEDEPAPRCYCGKHGCIETYLAGPAMAADHRARHGEELSPGDIAQRASAGDEAAASTLARYVRRLAKSLASVINLLDPDVVVLGGGVSNIDGLGPRVTEQLGDWVFSDVVSTRIVRADHGDSSGVRGAAWLWPGS